MYTLIILFILISSYLLGLVVEILNIKVITTELPVEFHGYYDAEKYKRSQNYLKDNTCFKIIHSTVMLAGILLFIFSGIFNYIDQFARSFNYAEIITGLIFVAILFLITQVIDIPFSIYHTFVIENRYGFNRTTPKTFIADILKGWILTFIIGGILLSAIIWFFMVMGDWACFWCWIGVTVFEMFLLFIAPVVIMPIFNKFTPLGNDELKQEIQTYADSQSFKLKGIFKIDASRRSTKSNAFFTGFGKYRRVALYDTLIKNHTITELVSILAHEIGHYKKNHFLKMIAVAIATNGLMFFILSLFINNLGLFSAFRMEETSIYASLLFFGFLYIPINMVLSILSNYISRKHEYEADLYAVNTYKEPEAFISALKKLSVDNLSNLSPHPLKVFLHYTHPPVLSRIRSIKKYKFVKNA